MNLNLFKIFILKRLKKTNRNKEIFIEKKKTENNRKNRYELE